MSQGWHDQTPAGVRLEWGGAGASRLATATGCLVVVDVLSFTTTTTIAVGRGIAVYPYRWKDESALGHAAARGATLARGRGRAGDDHPWSLSPAAMLSAPYVERLVLPSPNGSSISVGCASGYSDVVAASLRNVGAVARWLRSAGYGGPDRPVVVVPAGERWPDGSLRPAVEDLLGAGLVCDALDRAGCLLSAEAHLAAAAARHVGDVGATVRGCASGRELLERGFADDVAVAVQLDADDVVPLLRGEAFLGAG